MEIARYGRIGNKLKIELSDFDKGIFNLSNLRDGTAIYQLTVRNRYIQE